MEDFIRFAISEGFSSYGISSHAPLPFSTAWTMEWDRMDDYLSEFSRLKEKYADKIELAIGLEIDYLKRAIPLSLVFRNCRSIIGLVLCTCSILRRAKSWISIPLPIYSVN